MGPLGQDEGAWDMSILAWLIGSRFGRMIAGAGLTLLTFSIILLSMFRKGVNRERDRQKAATIKTVKDRIKIDEDVRKMPASDRRRELDRWVRG